MDGVGRDPEGVRDVVVAALLAASDGQSLVTVGEAATALRLAPGYLYAHSERLGGVRLGSGPKARIRFDVETLADRLLCRPDTPDPDVPTPAPRRPRPPRRPAPPHGDDLLSTRDRFVSARPRRGGD